MRIDMNTNMLLLLSFLIGFIVDIWSDTPGVNALGSTILAMLKRPLFYIYVPRDDRMKDIKPGINTLGISVYTKYLLTATFIFSTIVFCAEYMSFINLKDLLVMSLSSTLISFLLILGFDSLFSIKSEKK